VRRRTHLRFFLANSKSGCCPSRNSRWCKQPPVLLLLDQK
jgi:hypothetical protein